MFSSRAFWTIVIMVAYNLLATYGHYNQQLTDLINLILGAVTTYFHINPSAVYTPSGVTPPAPGQSVTLTQP